MVNVCTVIKTRVPCDKNQSYTYVQQIILTNPDIKVQNQESWSHTRSKWCSWLFKSLPKCQTQRQESIEASTKNTREETGI